ncbi:MAG: hypothetical protein OEO71_05480 [Gammaproteobacteria bacterium]|nr:hypothetical protein [Gammaproteobacteria bacterium]
MIAKIRATLPACLLVLALAGCSANVTMDEPAIPAPRVAKIPVNVALRIPAEFEHFVHEENVLGKESWTIDLGRANAAFFTQLFGHLFDGLTILGPDDDARDFQFDALIEPSIDGFEFSVPNQSKTEAFAVWIRYRLRIFDREGNNASNWTVSAYGKSQKQGMRGSDSLRRAAVLAMRDAAALIILQMEKATRISTLAGGGLAEPSIRQAQAAVDADANATQNDAEDDFGVFAIGGIEDE